ncbi:MAG: response regulator transcription factor, partial [Saprospiraceae bacterium]|nr:response regulator transcription factor [Saprospiraceae bacterium]
MADKRPAMGYSIAQEATRTGIGPDITSVSIHSEAIVGGGMDTQSILLAEDHTILREGIKAMLSSCPDCAIVGEAEDGREAIQKAQELGPDVILMDLSMPNINGTEAIRTIKKRNPSIRIIVLTMHRSREYVRATLEAGADGYVLKDDTQQDLMAAFASVRKGRVYLSSGICDKVIDGYLNRQA